MPQILSTSENGYHQAEQEIIHEALLKSELPCMFLVEDGSEEKTLMTAENYYICSHEPVLKVEGGNLRFYIHLGHLGSELIDDLVSSLPIVNYYTGAINVLEYLEHHGWPQSPGVWTPKWRAPCHDPLIHEARTLPDPASSRLWNLSGNPMMISNMRWDHYSDNRCRTRESRDPAADAHFRLVR